MIDKEIQELVNMINSFEGLTTYESCCGHGNARIRIWFRFDNFQNVVDFSKDIHDYRKFYIELWHGDFILTSAYKGEEAYREGREFASAFDWKLNNDT